MGYLVSGILLFLAWILYKKNETIAAPEVLFCIEWGFISFLASLRLFGLYDVSWLTWLIVLIGSISFLFGVSFGKKIKVKYSINEEKTGGNIDGFLMSKKCFWILLAIMTIYVLYDFSQTYQYLVAGYSLGQIREASVGMSEIVGYNRRTGALAEYIELIIGVVELLVVASGITYFISDVKKNYKIMLGVLLFETLYALTNGGRYRLAYIIIETLVGYFMYKSIQGRMQLEIPKALKRWIKRILVFIIVMILIITLMRGAETSELLQKYYRYICGNMVFLDVHIKKLNEMGYWSVSYAGLYGFWSVILPILNNLGITYPINYLETITRVMDTQTFQKIGENLVTNAFITPFYHIYADFRWIGLVIGIFIFGSIAGNVYKKARYYADGKHIAFYLILAQMIFKTLQTYPFASKNYVVVLVLIFIFEKRRYN